MMNQFTTFFKKEWLEMWRSIKFIWVPLVFIILGIMDAIMNYFMDDIVASVGNIPEGLEITLPDFTPIDIYTATTGEFQSIGLVVLVAILASSISRERQSGTATLLYVRPISFASYFLSKWAMAVVLAVGCIVLGYFSSFYYTNLLFGSVPFDKFLAMVGTYCLWITFVVSFTLAMSAAFKTSIAMAISILVIPIFIMIDSLIESLVGSFWTMTPWKLANYGVQILSGNVVWKDYYWTLAITVSLTIVFIALGIFMSKKNAATTKI